MNNGITRRSFLGALLAAGAFPHISGCRNFLSGDGKVRLAAIGVGAQAWYDICQLAKNDDICELVALCDTDIGAKHTLEALKRYPGLPRFHDFRKMFDKMERQIDAVLVATPDHSHFCACMHAMKLGKAVYVEKPLAHSFRECELLAKAEKSYGVVCQMGNQGHSGDNYYQYRDYVRAGILKDVRRVVAHMNMERRWFRWGGKIAAFPEKETIPPTLDWDSWLSGVSWHDYSRDFVNGEWRCWYDFGNGCMGDWGAHILDTIHEFSLNSELPGEVGIADVKGWNPYVFPIQSTITMSFPATKLHGNIEVEWREGLYNQPKPPEGFRFDSNAGLFPASSANEGLADPKLKPGKEIYLGDGSIWQGLSHSSTLRRVGHGGDAPKYEKSHNDHWRNFLLAVRGDEKPKSPFSVSAPLSELFCLGVAAQCLNRGFRFDPATKTAVGDDEANILLHGAEPRPQWKEYYRI